MALHKKNYPGPKNFVTKKYRMKKHNPRHGAVINVNRRRSGASVIRESSFGLRAQAGFQSGQLSAPTGSRISPRLRPALTDEQRVRRGLVPSSSVGKRFNPRLHNPAAQRRPVARTQSPGRRVGRNLSPGTPRRVGRFRPSVLGNVSATFGSRRVRPLKRGKKKIKRRNPR